MTLATPKRLKAPENLRNARRHEAETAARIGGRVTKGSGNGAEKGDARARGLVRAECKVTKARSFSVTLEMLEKIERAGALAGENPVLVVRFVGADGAPIKECCVVPAWILDQLGGAS